jgi:hypothetical protein
MSKVTATVHETQERPLAQARRAFEAPRAERAESALLDYEITPNHRLHMLDLIGAESVYFFDTWAL